MAPDRHREHRGGHAGRHNAPGHPGGGTPSRPRLWARRPSGTTGHHGAVRQPRGRRSGSRSRCRLRVHSLGPWSRPHSEPWSWFRHGCENPDAVAALLVAGTPSVRIRAMNLCDRPVEDSRKAACPSVALKRCGHGLRKFQNYRLGIVTTPRPMISGTFPVSIQWWRTLAA